MNLNILFSASYHLRTKVLQYHLMLFVIAFQTQPAHFLITTMAPEKCRSIIFTIVSGTLRVPSLRIYEQFEETANPKQRSQLILVWMKHG